MKQNLMSILDRIKNRTFLGNKYDNELLEYYLTAKMEGSYFGIDYGLGGTGCVDKTIFKNAINIRRALKEFNVPFHLLSRENILEFKRKLSKNEITAIKHKLVNRRSVKYQSPMSFSNKLDLFTNLRQFWCFYQEYSYQNTKKNIPDIFNRIKLKRPKETESRVDWLKSSQVQKLIEGLKGKNYLKLLLALAIDLGPRPIELVNLRKSHFTIETGVLYCRLPEIKGCSGRKHKVEVIYEREFVQKMLKRFTRDQLLFDYVDRNAEIDESPNCYEWDKKKYNQLRMKVKRLTEKYCSHPGTLYLFRRTSTMYWMEMSDNDIVWVQKRLGHVEGSDAIKAYMNFSGIKTPASVKGKVKSQILSEIDRKAYERSDENNKLKLQLDRMQNQMEHYQKMLMSFMLGKSTLNFSEDQEFLSVVARDVKEKMDNA